MDIEQIIDILEAGKPLSQDQRKALDDDPVLAEMVEDMLLGCHAIEENALSADKDKKKAWGIDDEGVEERLAAFHRTHQVEKENADCDSRVDSPDDGKPFHRKMKAMVRPLWVKALLTSAAAVALVAVFFPFGKEQQAVLNMSENGLMASLSQRSQQTKRLPTSVDETTAEQQITPQVIDSYLSKVDTVQLHVERGQQCKVVLPDGTHVFLHPGSKLVYPREFDGYERRVRLEGEAYFKVHKDKQHPFIVSTAGSETLVTGTEFDVTSSADAKEVSVTLINGSVQFASASKEHKVVLQPGQRVTLSHDVMDVCEADTMKYVAWRDGYLFFDNASLREILQQISSSYNLPVVCDDARLLDIRMHFVMRRDKDINYAIDILNKMKKMKASIVGGKLHITAC